LTRRPTSVSVAAALLVLAGLVSALVGLVATSLGGCCGASDGGDPLPALLGVGAGCLSALAGALLWGGGTGRSAVLLPAASVPLVCLAASASSVDLASLAPLAIAGWLALAWLVRRGHAAAWLTRRGGD
jgi:hypothetical protein